MIYVVGELSFDACSGVLTRLNRWIVDKLVVLAIDASKKKFLVIALLPSS